MAFNFQISSLRIRRFTCALLVVVGVVTSAGTAKAWTPTNQKLAISIFRECNPSRIDFDQKRNQYFYVNYCYEDLDPGPGTKQIRVGNAVGGNAVIKLDEQGNLVWARNIGFGEFVTFTSISTDAIGNSYLVGRFQQSSAYNYAVDFDPGPGLAMIPNFGRVDGFVLKLNTFGEYAWAYRFGGAGWDGADSIAIGPSGALYVSGLTYGTEDFDPGPGVSPISPIVRPNSFLLKLLSDGTFQWVKNLGSLGDPTYLGSETLAVDASENLLLTGSYTPQSAQYLDFDPGPGVVKLESPLVGFSYQTDVFVLKLNANGDFLWAKRIGGPESDVGKAITTDPQGSVFISGSFAGDVDFDPDVSVDVLKASTDDTPRRPSDGFILKLDGNGAYRWSRSFGSYQDDSGTVLTTDLDGNAYVVGEFSVNADIGMGTKPVVINAPTNSEGVRRGTFLVKVASDGAYLWSHGGGGDSQNFKGFTGVSVNNLNEVIAVGFGFGKSSFQMRSSNAIVYLDRSSGFISKLDSAGHFLSSKYSAPYLSKRVSVSAKAIAKYAKLSVQPRSSISLQIKQSSARNCKITKSTVIGVRSGVCSVIVVVRPRKGPSQQKVVLLEVART